MGVWTLDAGCASAATTSAPTVCVAVLLCMRETARDLNQLWCRRVVVKVVVHLVGFLLLALIICQGSVDWSGQLEIVGRNPDAVDEDEWRQCGGGRA